MLGAEERDLLYSPVIKSCHDLDHDFKHISTLIQDDQDKKNGEKPSALLNPDDLVECTLLLDPQDDGHQFMLRLSRIMKIMLMRIPTSLSCCYLSMMIRQK
jgi:hypothetical protein